MGRAGLNEYDIGSVLRAAQFCGDCGRNFDEIAGDYCYVRIQPARLICHDCKLKEAPRLRLDSVTTPK